jgi:hypothetical protein
MCASLSATLSVRIDCCKKNMLDKTGDSLLIAEGRVVVAGYVTISSRLRRNDWPLLQRAGFDSHMNYSVEMFDV